MVEEIRRIVFLTSQEWEILVAEAEFFVKEKAIRNITRMREEINRIKLEKPIFRILFIVIFVESKIIELNLNSNVLITEMHLLYFCFPN